MTIHWLDYAIIILYFFVVVYAHGGLEDGSHRQNLHPVQPEAEEKAHDAGNEPPGAAVVQPEEVAHAVDVLDVVHAPGNVQAREDLVDHHADEPGEDHDARGDRKSVV